MSLLQSPRRPSSAALALGPTEAFGAVGDDQDPDRPFSGSGSFDDEPDGPRVDLGRELDLSTERPQANGQAGRGPGLLVASIVTTSIVLGAIIMLVRGDEREAQAVEPAAPPAITEVVAAPAEPAAVEPVPAQPVPPKLPSRIATQRVPEPAKAEPARTELTPAAIAPAVRPSAPPTSTEQPAAPAEPAGALAPGLQLPAPVFDDPQPAAPEPTTPPAPAPTDDASQPLPGIEERAPEGPRDEPGAAAPEPTPEAAALPTGAGTPEPFERETFDRLPARTDRPAS